MPAEQGEVFRTPATMRYLSLAGTALLALVSALFVSFSIFLIFKSQWGLALTIGLVAVFMAALTGYVLRDFRGRWGLRVELGTDRMVLDLPSGRSLIHKPKSEHIEIPYREVAAVETRLEAFPTLGMESMQRAYVLARKHGEPIYLFEDRALGTGLSQEMYGKIAETIVARAGVPMRDLGMVEGGGGFLAMWGAHTPEWSAPSLPLEQQLRVWRHVAATGSMAFTLIILAFMIRALVR